MTAASSVTEMDSTKRASRGGAGLGGGRGTHDTGEASDAVEAWRQTQQQARGEEDEESKAPGSSFVSPENGADASQPWTAPNEDEAGDSVVEEVGEGGTADGADEALTVPPPTSGHRMRRQRHSGTVPHGSHHHNHHHHIKSFSSPGAGPGGTARRLSLPPLAPLTTTTTAGDGTVTIAATPVSGSGGRWEPASTTKQSSPTGGGAGASEHSRHRHRLRARSPILMNAAQRRDKRSVSRRRLPHKVDHFQAPHTKARRRRPRRSFFLNEDYIRFQKRLQEMDGEPSANAALKSRLLFEEVTEQYHLFQDLTRPELLGAPYAFLTSQYLPLAVSDRREMVELFYTVDVKVFRCVFGDRLTKFDVSGVTDPGRFWSAWPTQARTATGGSLAALLQSGIREGSLKRQWENVKMVCGTLSAMYRGKGDRVIANNVPLLRAVQQCFGLQEALAILYSTVVFGFEHRLTVRLFERLQDFSEFTTICTIIGGMWCDESQLLLRTRFLDSCRRLARVLEENRVLTELHQMLFGEAMRPRWQLQLDEVQRVIATGSSDKSQVAAALNMMSSPNATTVFSPSCVATGAQSPLANAAGAATGGELIGAGHAVSRGELHSPPNDPVAPTANSGYGGGGSGVLLSAASVPSAHGGVSNLFSGVSSPSGSTMFVSPQSTNVYSGSPMGAATFSSVGAGGMSGGAPSPSPTAAAAAAAVAGSGSSTTTPYTSAICANRLFSRRFMLEFPSLMKYTARSALYLATSGSINDALDVFYSRVYVYLEGASARTAPALLSLVLSNTAPNGAPAATSATGGGGGVGVGSFAGRPSLSAPGGGMDGAAGGGGGGLTASSSPASGSSPGMGTNALQPRQLPTVRSAPHLPRSLSLTGLGGGSGGGAEMNVSATSLPATLSTRQLASTAERRHSSLSPPPPPAAATSSRTDSVGSVGSGTAPRAGRRVAASTCPPQLLLTRSSAVPPLLGSSTKQLAHDTVTAAASAGGAVDSAGPAEAAARETSPEEYHRPPTPSTPPDPQRRASSAVAFTDSAERTPNLPAATVSSTGSDLISSEVGGGAGGGGGEGSAPAGGQPTTTVSGTSTLHAAAEEEYRMSVADYGQDVAGAVLGGASAAIGRDVNGMTTGSFSAALASQAAAMTTLVNTSLAHPASMFLPLSALATSSASPAAAVAGSAPAFTNTSVMTSHGAPSSPVLSRPSFIHVPGSIRAESGAAGAGLFPAMAASRDDEATLTYPTTEVGMAAGSFPLLPKSGPGSPSPTPQSQAVAGLPPGAPAATLPFSPTTVTTMVQRAVDKRYLRELCQLYSLLPTVFAQLTTLSPEDHEVLDQAVADLMLALKSITQVLMATDDFR